MFNTIRNKSQKWQAHSINSSHIAHHFWLILEKLQDCTQIVCLYIDSRLVYGIWASWRATLSWCFGGNCLQQMWNELNHSKHLEYVAMDYHSTHPNNNPSTRRSDLSSRALLFTISLSESKNGKQWWGSGHSLSELCLSSHCRDKRFLVFVFYFWDYFQSFTKFSFALIDV